MARKMASIINIEKMDNQPVGKRFVCISGGDLFGRTAVVVEGFMNVVWEDTKESLSDDPFAKHYMFIKDGWAM